MQISATGSEPGFSIYQSLLVWRPMLIGLSLILAALISEFFVRYAFPFARLLPIPLMTAALGWGLIWTHVNTPWEFKDLLPSPRIVERIATRLDALAGNGKVAVFWYGGWNSRILEYYRRENDLPPLEEFPFQDINNIWSMTDYSEQKRALMLAQMKKIFAQASLIIVPEFLDEYNDQAYYTFYRFKHDWAAWLNSDEAPRFRVLMLLPENKDVRLLVIAREELAQGRGDPLRLPYGDRPKTSQPDYSAAVLRAL